MYFQKSVLCVLTKGGVIMPPLSKMTPVGIEPTIFSV